MPNVTNFKAGILLKLFYKIHEVFPLVFPVTYAEHFYSALEVILLPSDYYKLIKNLSSITVETGRVFVSSLSINTSRLSS